MSGWLGVWVCSSSLVSWCHCGALGCSRPPVQHPAGSMASWSSHLGSPRHGTGWFKAESRKSVSAQQTWKLYSYSLESLFFHLSPRFPSNYKMNCIENWHIALILWLLWLPFDSYNKIGHQPYVQFLQSIHYNLQHTATENARTPEHFTFRLALSASSLHITAIRSEEFYVSEAVNCFACLMDIKYQS